MWTGQTMTFMDSVVISLLGILVVFTCLACIAVSIVIISKIINTIIKPEAPKAAVAAAAAPAPAIDEEAYAVLVAAVTEEARLSGDGDVRVVSIKEL
ncbi:MAG: OadG family protein [Lachnospiraceae bacterium]|nr:OadG family protein [Lachnospiraceae bacterium]MBQ5870392.1 OadG family protein [Lachnospiraceae bacterium]